MRACSRGAVADDMEPNTPRATYIVVGVVVHAAAVRVRNRGGVDDDKVPGGGLLRVVDGFGVAAVAAAAVVRRRLRHGLTRRRPARAARLAACLFVNVNWV